MSGLKSHNSRVVLVSSLWIKVQLFHSRLQTLGTTWQRISVDTQPQGYQALPVSIACLATSWNEIHIVLVSSVMTNIQLFEYNI